MRGADQDTIPVIIEPPLPIAADSEPDDALQSAAQRFGNLLESYVMCYPAEWHDWKRPELPRESAD